MKAHAAQLSGLQYELAMALSSSLDLEAMLESVLSILLSRLDARCAAVFAGDGDGALRLLLALPQSAATSARQHADEARADASIGSPSHRLDRLANGAERHRFCLPGFGALTLERRGKPLAAEVLRALEPVMQRLGRAARACVDHAAVRSSEARFAELVATIPEVIFECRLAPDGAIAFDYVSPRSGEVLGLDAATLVAQPRVLLEQVCPEDREALMAALGVAAARRASFEHLVRLDDRGPHARWLRFAGSPRGPGEDSRWSGLIQDITAQQRLVSAEREAAQRRMSSLLGLAGDAMIGMDSSGRITHWNRAAEELLGYPASAILGEPLTRIMPERMRAAHTLGLARHMATGETKMVGRPLGKLPALHAEGHELQVELMISRVEDQGEVFFVAVLRDITERLRTEREQTRSVEEERRFSSALLDLGQVSLVDPAALEQRVTSVVAEALGIARVSLWSLDPASITCLDLFETADGRHSAGLVLEEQTYRPYFAALREESIINAPDARTYRATACFRESYLEPLGIVSMLDVPLRTLEGVSGVLCMESTERRDWRDTEVRFCVDAAALLGQAMERMERVRLEARHEIILASIGEAVIACDLKQRITLINPFAELLTGWPSAEAVGRPLGEVYLVLSAETLDPVETPVIEVLESGRRPGPTGSTLLLTRRGEQIPVASSAHPITEHGRLLGAVLTFRDVREEQASVRALEEQNLRLHTLRLAIPDMLFSVSIDGRVRYEKTTPSPDLLAPPEEMAKHTVGSLFPPETAEQLHRAVAETVRTGEVQVVEYAIRDPQGEQFFEARLARLSDDETTVMVRNVTEDRSREDALREERARLAMVLASTSAIIYSARLPDFAIEYASDSIGAVLGFTAQEYSEPGFWERAVHPDDLARVIGGLGGLFATGRHVHEYRHRHADGTYRWLRDEVRLVNDDDGRPVRAVGASFDITDRKLSESRLTALLTVQQIVARVSATFLRSHSGLDDHVLDEVLGGLGRFTRADRAYIFQTDGPLVDNTHEWCEEGTLPQKLVLQRMPAAEFGFFLQPLEEGKPLYIPSVTALPPEAKTGKDMLSAQGIESLLAVPLMVDGSIRGFVGINNPDLDPLDPGEFAELMQVLADTLAAGIERARIERERQRLNDRLTDTLEQQSMLLKLSTDVARATSRSELFATLQNRILPVLVGRRVSLMYRGNDGNYRVRLLDFELGANLGGDITSAEGLEVEFHGDMQQCAPGLAMKRMTPVTTREHKLTDFPEWARFSETLGYDQFVVLPLVRPSGVFGTLNVAFTRREPPTSEEVDRIATFGSLLSAHLTLHEARDALQSLNAELEARVEARSCELRASEERFERLFQQAPQAMLIVDGEQRIVQWNQKAQHLFRVEDDAFVGTPVNDLVPVAHREQHTHLMDGFRTQHEAMMMGGRSVQAMRRDGSVFSAEIGLVPIDLNGERNVLAGITDVTDRIEAQAAVTRSLEEKETLLKEIHHRVKNNLQIISSLLTLQSDKMPSDRARELLQESVFRVRSMALIHQLLYGVESLERIEFGDYARRLATSLRSALAPHARLRVDASVVEVTVEIAVPLGLILNELLTNAFKYGLPVPMADGSLPPRRTGEGCDILIEVGLADEDQLRLAVTDSGNGLPAGFEPEQANTLGLRLVRSLNHQLRGKLEFDVDRGGRFVITFSHTTGRGR